VGGGAPLWSWLYGTNAALISPEIGSDMVLDPISGDLVVVGRSSYLNGTMDGVIMRINPGTGVPNGTIDYYGTPSSSEQFNCVAVSNDPSTGFGVIVGGAGQIASCSGADGWLVRIDNANTPLWSNVYDYAVPCTNNFFTDVMERLNTFGNYVYYAAGNSSFSGSITVDQVDAAGNSIVRYAYGTPGSSYVTSIDKNDIPGSTPGFTLFGNDAGTLGLEDMTIYKVYYNGVTACNYGTVNTQNKLGPSYLGTLPLFYARPFNDVPASASPTPAMDNTLCFQPTVSGGSNLQMIPMSPPPASQLNMVVGENAGQMTAMLKHSSVGPASVKVYDMFGRLVFEKNVQLQEDENLISLQLDGYKLSSGIYTVNVTQADNSTSAKIVITK
jgi:hypothetical protein